MKELRKELFVIYECFTKQVFSNPVRVNPSYGVDWHFTWLDKVDLKQCCFSTEKAAKRKLAKLRELYLAEKQVKDGYRQCLLVGDDDPKGLHVPDQQEFEDEILRTFDRHYVVKPISWLIRLED